MIPSNIVDRSDLLFWSHINYSSSRQVRATWCDAATCGLCRHNLGMLCACWRDIEESMLWQQTLSRRFAYTQATCIMLIVHVGLVWTSTLVVIRKAYCSWSSCISLRVWSRTQITLALRDCMVLISVNTVLGLLKRLTCVRGRTHSVVCCYLRAINCGS